jgi:hypothetical protein
MKNSTVWLGTFSDINTDPRPLKARGSLVKSGFRTMELMDNSEDQVRLSRISSWLQMLFWGSIFHLGLTRDRAIRNFLNARMRKVVILKKPVSVDDVILLFDIDLLPFVTEQFPSNPIVIDFREIYTEQFGKDIKFRLFLRPIRKHILENDAKKIKAGYTVSRGLINYYQNNFMIQLSLIRSVPLFQGSQSASGSAGNIKIVYLGVAHPLRNIEKSIKVIMEIGQEIEFHLYLVGDKSYIESLKKTSEGSHQIFFHSPVDFHKINETLCKYDLGWCYFTPETENIKNALPNKFFDYIQAGLGVICGPNLDMLEEAKSWNFGFFTPDYSDRALNQLLTSFTRDSIESAKISAKLAKSELTWENEELKFLQLVESVIQG